VPAQVDLTFNVTQARDGRGWQSSVIYATDLFDDATVRTMVERLLGQLRFSVENPAAAVYDYPLVDVDRYTRELVRPRLDTPNAGRTLVDLFADTASTNGHRAAVTALDRTITFAELDARSNAVATGLLARGVRGGDLVGVATRRSADLVTTILGVMKAGAGYLPLDTGNPVDRIEYILTDAEPAVVVVDEETRDLDLWRQVGDLAALVRVDDLIGDVPAMPVTTHVSADMRAYVIYTSGSTGRPKGVGSRIAMW